MKLRILAFVALVTLPAIGSADNHFAHHMSVQLLRTDCELPDRSSQIRCEAFLVGVVDTVNALSAWWKLDNNYFCAPEGTTDVDLRKTLVEYLASSSSVDPAEPAASLVVRAFGEAFPCK